MSASSLIVYKHFTYMLVHIKIKFTFPLVRCHSVTVSLSKLIRKAVVKIILKQLFLKWVYLLWDCLQIITSLFYWKTTELPLWLRYVCYSLFSGSSGSKESACSVGNPGLIPGWGRSPGEGNGYPTPVFFAWRIPQTEYPGRIQTYIM